MRTAYNAALDLLARREHGAKELAQKLIGKGFEPDVVFDAISRLQAAGLQNDARFTESKINDCVRRGLGPVRIRLTLQDMGVDSDVIETALANCTTDWWPAMQAVWQKKFNQVPEDYAARAKQARFLVYRGFAPDSVQQLLHSIASEVEDNDCL